MFCYLKMISLFLFSYHQKCYFSFIKNIEVTLWRHRWRNHHDEYFSCIIWDDLSISDVKLKLCVTFWHFQNGRLFEVTANFLPEVILMSSLTYVFFNVGKHARPDVTFRDFRPSLVDPEVPGSWGIVACLKNGGHLLRFDDSDRSMLLVNIMQSAALDLIPCTLAPRSKLIRYKTRQIWGIW